MADTFEKIANKNAGDASVLSLFSGCIETGQSTGLASYCARDIMDIIVEK